MTTSHKIADNLYLVRQELILTGPPPKPAAPPPTNHIVVVDCSGSMWGELDKVKAQLKNKLATLLGPQDTVTIIWFSGRNQCGIVIEAEPVASLPNLAAVHKAIDRWLNPVGLTGFKEPIELAAKIAGKLVRKGVCSLFFMSDGCDNQWSRPEILKTVEIIAASCAAATFVEYGFYADRALLAAMAEKAGGVHIHCADFPHYEPAFAAVMQKHPAGGKRIEVSIEGDPLLGFAFAGSNGDLLTFGVEFSKIAVPEDIASIYYLSPTPVATESTDLAEIARGFTTHGGKLPYANLTALEAAYAAMSLLAVRMKPDIIYPILRALGDVEFIERFAACFGKQQYSLFMDAARAVSNNARLGFTKGRDPSKVPDDNAFTVLQLLQVLAEDDDARVLFDHPAWTYARIGRQRIDAEDALSPEDQAKLTELTGKLGKAKGAKAAKVVQAEIDALLAKKQGALVFTPDPAPEGYPISGLVLNEERPNVSIRVRKEGTVDLSARIAATTGPKLSALPAPFPTFIYRAYTIIKDGLVNVEKLPVRMSTATHDKLVREGVSVQYIPGAAGDPVAAGTTFAVIDLTPLPCINRSMVKAPRAADLFELEWQLTQARARQKVCNAFSKDLAPPRASKGYASVYGPVIAEWLREQGLTDGNGFSPKVVAVPPSGDFYMAKKLEVGLKGFASLPSVEDARTKMKSGKPLTGGAALMAPVIAEMDKYIAANKAAPDAVRIGWVEGLQKVWTAETRALLFRKAQAVFVTVVGQVWFEEFPTLDDKTLTMALAMPSGPPVNVLCTASLEEEKIEL